MKIDEFEYGMTYFVSHGFNSSFIFKYEKPSTSSSSNVVGIDIISTYSNWFKMNEPTEITIGLVETRRATVEEEVWLDECRRAKKRLEKDEAIANFNKRFE
jgi:hypothetical protein